MRVGIGQDSHRFDFNETNKKLILGGVIFEDAPAVSANSDGDVILHAITNAISGVTGTNILGRISDDMCKSGITDSEEYVKEALKYMEEDMKIHHISISIECKTPKISPLIPSLKESIARILSISERSIGITATTGEGLTDFGKGLGIQVFCIITTD